MRLNFIPREGGNSFSGMLISSFTNEGMAGDNFTQELRNRGLRTPNNVRKSGEINVAYGGRFGATGLVLRDCSLQPDAELGRWHVGESERLQSDVIRLRSRPDQPAFTDVLTRNGAGRVTWQVNSTHKLAFA